MCLKLRRTDVFLESAHSLTPTLEFVSGKSIKIVEWFLQRTVKHRRKLNSFSVFTKQKSQPGEYPVCRLNTAANCLFKSHGICYSSIQQIVDNLVDSLTNWPCSFELECGRMPNLMVALPNIGGALCSTPQSLADAHY